MVRELNNATTVRSAARSTCGLVIAVEQRWSVLVGIRLQHNSFGQVSRHAVVKLADRTL